jgi:hypothetical protein
MRSLQLQAVLTDLIQAAASHLHAEVLGGAEVQFELEPRMGRRGSMGTALYCYRALTGEFLDARQQALAGLAGYGEAVRLLEGFEGLEPYLASVGVELAPDGGRARATAAIRALLEETFEEQTDFELRPERMRAALARLEQAAHGSPRELTLVASLHGLVIGSAELALTRGLTIAQPDALDGLPDVLAGGATNGQPADHLVVALTSEEDDRRTAVSRGCEVMRDLLRALRLFGDGRVTLGALAWVRAGDGAWTPLALGTGGRPHGMLVVGSEQEDELRAFCNLVSRRAPHDNELAWALRRFELGCERDSPYEALTDHLLALRALLEPEGPGSGLLARRLGALCATPEQRAELTERMIQALVLEQAVQAGNAVEHAGGHALAGDVSDNLRALLRDVICGHLTPDLIGLADELLAAAQEHRDGEAAPDEGLAAAVQETTDDDADRCSEATAAAGAVPAAALDSGEQVLGDAGQAVEILDLFI